MKVLIIDDEHLARGIIKNYLSDDDRIEVIGECSNGFEGYKLINELKPDLVFLDVMMPKLTGFEMLELLEDPPFIIFSTAYDEYAIKAFEYNALDYLQKPIKAERLAQALEKIQQTETLPQEERKLLTDDSQVFVKEGEKCWFVSLKDIRLFEVMDNYTRIYFSEEKPMIPKTLRPPRILSSEPPADRQHEMD